MIKGMMVLIGGIQRIMKECVRDVDKVVILLSFVYWTCQMTSNTRSFLVQPLQTLQLLLLKKMVLGKRCFVLHLNSLTLSHLILQQSLLQRRRIANLNIVPRVVRTLCLVSDFNPFPVTLPSVTVSHLGIPIPYK